MAQERREELGAGPSAGQWARWGIVGLLVLAVVLLVVDNTDDVRIGYVFGDAEVPLLLAFLLVFVAGLVCGWLLGRRSGRGRG